MGGDVTHEFQVLTEVGEDRIAICTNCDYRANLEKATRKIAPQRSPDAIPAPTPVATPGTTSIEALEKALGLPASAFLKTLLLRTKDGVVAVVLPGDREANEPKLRKLLDVPSIQFAKDSDFAAVGGVAGFVGPVGLRNARVLMDVSLEPRGYVAGANKQDTHLRDVVPGRDFGGERVDVHDVREGDACPRCGGRLEIKRGVEVGNIFAYGTYYSEKMNATFEAEDGSRKPFVGGSYGIGVGRSVQTIIETHHDERGIVWPPAVAPYQAHVLALPASDDAVRAKAEALGGELDKLGIEVLYDDRDESAGVKFADADLIGIPLRVTVSKRNLAEDKVELKPRAAKDVEFVPAPKAAVRIAEIVRSWPR